MRVRFLLMCFILVLSGCSKNSLIQQPRILSEFFTTEHKNGLNVDSVAVWHGDNNQHWLIATAKSAHTLPVYNAATGALIKTIGSPGTLIGQLQRPNGIAVLDDFLFIVERDNKRLQVFSLPDGVSIGIINDLELPYGIAAYTIQKGKKYMLYVTENAGPRKGRTPKKVHQYLASLYGKYNHFFQKDVLK